MQEKATWILFTAIVSKSGVVSLVICPSAKVTASRPGASAIDNFTKQRRCPLRLSPQSGVGLFTVKLHTCRRARF